MSARIDHEYFGKRISFDDGMSMIKSGHRVVSAMAAAEPRGLLERIGHHALHLSEVTLYCANPAADYPCFTTKELAGVLAGPTGVQLRLVNGSSVTTIATGTATVTATSTVAIRRVGSTVTVAVNDTTAITYALTAAQVTTLSGGTRTGLYWAAGSTVRFTTMLATAP